MSTALIPRSARNVPVAGAWARWYRPLVLGLWISGALVWAAYLVVIGVGDPIDVRAYYLAEPGRLYERAALGGTDAYLYSPAFAQALDPLRLLGWDAFREVWRLAEVGALFTLAGPLAGLFILARPVAVEVNAGNIHLLLTLAIVAGFRWPWAWSFVLLTKVTPGVGLLWFAVRGEWRQLGIALGATAAIAGVSLVIDPGAWGQWFGTLATLTGTEPRGWILASGPLALRMVAAALLVIWAARTDRRWGVVAAAFLALPVTWVTALSMGAGLVALAAPETQRTRPAPGGTRRGMREAGQGPT